MQLPLSLPPVLPSHRLESKMTPCHIVPSCALSHATLSPLAASGGFMCLRPCLRPHWCHAEGAGRDWHWPGIGTGHCLFSTTSLSGGNTPKVRLWVWVQADIQIHKEDTIRHMLSVFPPLPWIRFLSVRSTTARQGVTLWTCLFTDSCRECYFPKDGGIRRESKRKPDTQKHRWTDELHGPADWKTLVLKARATKYTLKLFDCKHDPVQPHKALLEMSQCWPYKGDWTLSLSAAARNITRELAKK